MALNVPLAATAKKIKENAIEREREDMDKLENIRTNIDLIL
jgi:hypothetical protein